MVPPLSGIGEQAYESCDCANAQLNYSLTDDDLAGDMDISRLIPGGQALCEELAGADGTMAALGRE